MKQAGKSITQTSEQGQRKIDSTPVTIITISVIVFRNILKNTNSNSEAIIVL